MATSRLRRKLERDGAPGRVHFGESFVKVGTKALMQFGTPLPAVNDHRKDKNEYKPIWEQEAYDERGRRRFHGAFTGGFSAGYFNTVGSKEGWTPSTFRSSRKHRANAAAQRPEDFMDAEDLAELDRESKLSTTDAYAETPTSDPFLQMLDAHPHDTVQARASQLGQGLLRRMGWKPGQGIGPLVSYARREQLVALLQSLHLAPPRPAAPEEHSEVTRHKFPPPDTQPVRVQDNRDKHGLGLVRGTSALEDALQRFHGEQAQRKLTRTSLDSDEEDDVYGAPQDIRDSTLGARHDTLRIGGEVHAAAHDPAPLAPSEATWHDGRPLPKGFVLGQPLDAATVWFDPPHLPPDWTPDPRRVWAQHETRASSVRPQHAADRGKLLGEARLPGPPPAIAAYLGEQAAKRMQAVHTDPPKAQPLTVHPIEAETAVRALDAFVPVGRDTEKQARYKAYLQAFADRTSYTPPAHLAHAQEELDAFYESAQRYRPMQGPMASRFTSTTMLQADTPGLGGFLAPEAAQAKREEPLPDPSPRTPAQQAARAGEFGDCTRSIALWNPPRLLCKRLGVPPPHPDYEANETKRVLEKFGADSAASVQEPMADPNEAFVDAPRSEAVEQAHEAALTEARPALDIFKAVFESDGEDDDAEAGAEAAPSSSDPLPLKRKTDTEKPKKKSKGRRVGPLTFDPDEV